jgi:ATPase subunit of ABC transporter with duplicated ATPase domains
MGPNGAGKSTFLKLVTNKLQPNFGTISHHSTATVAYFAQHHVMELNLQHTPMLAMKPLKLNSSARYL